jgi:hypothetical protein
MEPTHPTAVVINVIKTQFRNILLGAVSTFTAHELEALGFKNKIAH